MAQVACEVEGCPDAESGRLFASEGALRFHVNAKHGGRAGLCPECGREFGNLASHMRVHRRPAEPVAAPSDPFDVADLDGEAVSEERPPVDFGGPVTEPFTPTAKVRLTSRGGDARRSLRDRVQSRVWGKDTPPAPPGGGAGYESPKATGEKRPKRQAARADAGTVLGLAWASVGGLLMRSGADVPVGRVMQFQAPVAGDVLDRLIARTWVDRIVQPIARKSDDVEALGALFALPALVALMERNEEAAVALDGTLRAVISANLDAMAPAVKKAREKERKHAKAVEELNLGLPAGADPVEAILQAIFAPPAGAETAGQEGAETGANGVH